MFKIKNIFNNEIMMCIDLYFPLDKNKKDVVNEVNWEFLKLLYNKFLINDKKWHFFWEGDHITIRCTKKVADRIRKYLDKIKVGTFILSEYKENIDITSKYIHSFIDIFHGLSVIAITLEEKCLEKVLERINHCFLNMCCMTEDVLELDRVTKSGYFKVNWEELIISRIALARSKWNR